MDDGCLDMTKAFHVGCRGSVIGEDVLVEDKQQGWTTIDLDMFVDIGPVEAARRVREQIGDTPTIVSVDMDVLEPGECPGVGFIEAGGMTCRELFRFLRALKGLNVIGGEVSQTGVASTSHPGLRPLRRLRPGGRHHGLRDHVPRS